MNKLELNKVYWTKYSAVDCIYLVIEINNYFNYKIKVLKTSSLYLYKDEIKNLSNANWIDNAIELNKIAQILYGN